MTYVYEKNYDGIKDIICLNTGLDCDSFSVLYPQEITINTASSLSTYQKQQLDNVMKDRGYKEKVV